MAPDGQVLVGYYGQNSRHVVVHLVIKVFQYDLYDGNCYDQRVYRKAFAIMQMLITTKLAIRWHPAGMTAMVAYTKKEPPLFSTTARSFLASPKA